MRDKFSNRFPNSSNRPQTLKNLLASLLAISLQRHQKKSPPSLVERPFSIAMSLYAADGGRKYLNFAERWRFIQATTKLPIKARLFCVVLVWSGGRISEVLAITPRAIDLDAGTVSLETLKKRRRGIVRQVPLPSQVLRELNQAFGLRVRQRDPALASRRLWPWHRSTGWRHVKKAMRAANILGSAAMPKGLRHAFGVAAFATVPPHLVQRWLGHASLSTTGIYGDVSGPEERLLAARMWQRKPRGR